MSKAFVRCLAALLVLAHAALAPAEESPPGDEPEKKKPPMAIEEITVTGRVRQGGAQDIRYFRGEVAAARIPHPDTLTPEGLFGAHDIVLPATGECTQLLCLTGDAVRADLIAAPAARYLAGIGFASDLPTDSWHRDRLNLIAVVDRSGSMEGRPLELVRKSLHAMLQQLGEGDQLSIVVFGDFAWVHLEPQRVTRKARRQIEASIDVITSAGSTDMEAGLEVGYKVARSTVADFDGPTRVLLFTDERPNVGDTSAGGFMAMAEGASRMGIGLTTIGVGVQFGAELAKRVGSVRGGNLYFLRSEADVRAVFSEQFDALASELAHDLRLTIAPRAGLKIGAVYGVPGHLLGWQGDAITLTIPTVFLDPHGGGIFFTLVPDAVQAQLPEPAEPLPLADVALSYQPLAAAGSPGSDSLTIVADASVSPGMALGRVLVDEFAALHRATSAHYLENDQETAYQLANALRARLRSARSPGLEEERELVEAVADHLGFLAGHGVEPVPTFLRLLGRWRVARVVGETSLARRGDILEFGDDGFLRIYRDADATWSEKEPFQSNEIQVYLVDSDLVLDYSPPGQLLRLKQRGGAELVLTRRE